MDPAFVQSSSPLSCSRFVPASNSPATTPHHSRPFHPYLYPSPVFRRAPPHHHHRHHHHNNHHHHYHHHHHHHYYYHHQDAASPLPISNATRAMDRSEVDDQFYSNHDLQFLFDTLPLTATPTNNRTTQPHTPSSRVNGPRPAHGVESQIRILIHEKSQAEAEREKRGGGGGARLGERPGARPGGEARLLSSSSSSSSSGIRRRQGARVEGKAWDVSTCILLVMSSMGCSEGLIDRYYHLIKNQIHRQVHGPDTTTLPQHVQHTHTPHASSHPQAAKAATFGPKSQINSTQAQALPPRTDDDHDPGLLQQPLWWSQIKSWDDHQDHLLRQIFSQKMKGRKTYGITYAILYEIFAFHQEHQLQSLNATHTSTIAYDSYVTNGPSNASHFLLPFSPSLFTYLIYASILSDLSDIMTVESFQFEMANILAHLGKQLIVLPVPMPIAADSYSQNKNLSLAQRLTEFSKAKAIANLVVLFRKSKIGTFRPSFINSLKRIKQVETSLAVDATTTAPVSFPILKDWIHKTCSTVSNRTDGIIMIRLLGLSSFHQHVPVLDVDMWDSNSPSLLQNWMEIAILLYFHSPGELTKHAIMTLYSFRVSRPFTRNLFPLMAEAFWRYLCAIYLISGAPDLDQLKSRVQDAYGPFSQTLFDQLRDMNPSQIDDQHTPDKLISDANRQSIINYWGNNLLAAFANNDQDAINNIYDQILFGYVCSAQKGIYLDLPLEQVMTSCVFPENNTF